MALGCALFCSVVAAPAASAQCGQRTTGYPSDWTGGGRPPLVIGDSVLYDAVPTLAHLGFQSDAMVCRQMSQGLALLRQRGATLPHLVVLELGTNGLVSEAYIDEALNILGPARVLVMLTPYHGVTPSDAYTIRSAARLHRGRMMVLDWDRLAGEHPQWLAPDGIHLSGAAGIAGFAKLVASVLPFAAEPPCDN